MRSGVCSQVKAYGVCDVHPARCLRLPELPIYEQLDAGLQEVTSSAECAESPPGAGRRAKAGPESGTDYGLVGSAHRTSIHGLWLRRICTHSVVEASALPGGGSPREGHRYSQH